MKMTESEVLTHGMTAHAHQWGIDLVSVTDAAPCRTKTYLRSKKRAYRCGQGIATEVEPDLFDPQQVMPDARSVIMLGTYTYGVDHIVPSTPGTPRGKIGPWTRLYHFMSGQMADVVINYLAACGYKAVYTNDLPYRTLAAKGGMGEIGRNHFLYTKEFGSYIRLSCVVTDAPLQDTAIAYDFAKNRCGTCRICEQSCPTQCMHSDGSYDYDICLHQLLQGAGDAREGGIPHAFWGKTGGYLMRTGRCLEVCPRNSKLMERDAIPAYIQNFPDFNKPDSPRLIPLVLAGDDEMEFLLPVAVYKYGKNNVRQNAILALGQHKDPAAIPVLEKCLLTATHPLNAQMAAWALGMIGGDDAARALREASMARLEPEILSEIDEALRGLSTKEAH